MYFGDARVGWDLAQLYGPSGNCHGVTCMGVDWVLCSHHDCIGAARAHARFGLCGTSYLECRDLGLSRQDHVDGPGNHSEHGRAPSYQGSQISHHVQRLSVIQAVLHSSLPHLQSMHFSHGSSLSLVRSLLCAESLTLTLFSHSFLLFSG